MSSGDINENIYESIDSYRKKSSMICSRSSSTCSALSTGYGSVPEAPPPLPQRNSAEKLSHDSDNDLTTSTHSLYEEAENQPSASSGIGLLIDVSENVDPHFDSIPMPKYFGPKQPIRVEPCCYVSDYLVPHSKDCNNNITQGCSEPVYAKIIKSKSSKAI